MPYFNPRAPYGARHHTGSQQYASRDISIHAPHTGRDSDFFSSHSVPSDFNPRAPYGARPSGPVIVTVNEDFNPRAPYGARLAFRHVHILLFSFQSTRPIRGATSSTPGSP